MINIAICDDELDIQNKLHSYVCAVFEKIDMPFQIHTFECAEALQSAMQKNTYDLVLLDILMKEMDGIQLSKYIEKHFDTYIIFISSYQARWRELFSKNVVGFVDKPIDSSVLFPLLYKVIQLCKSQQEDCFTYKKKGMTYSIALNSIIYIESIQHNILIHTSKEVITLRKKLSDVWSRLEQTNSFCRPNRSYVVNMQYISVSKSNVMIQNKDTSISIGRKFKEDTIMRFMNYLHSKGNMSL